MLKYNDMGTKKKLVKKTSRHVTSDGHTYLTKKILVSRAKAAGKRAASSAMDVMGYVIVVEGENIIRKNADGSKVIVAPVEKEDQNQDVVLD